MSLSSGYREKAAKEALSRGELNVAEQILREAVAQDRSDYRSLVMLAYVLRERNEAAESAAIAEQAIPLKPQMAEAYFQLGLSLLQLSQPQGAVHAFRKATTLRPEISDFHGQLGRALEASGRRAEAQECFNHAASLRSQEVGVKLSLASRMLRDDDLHGAANQIRAALEIEPDSVSAHLTMAEIAMLAGEGEVAEQHIRRVLHTDPRNGSAYAFLGRRLSQKGDLAGAIEALKKSLELNPSQGFSYLGLLRADSNLQQNPQLLTAMEQLHAGTALSAQERSALCFGLALMYEKAGDYGRSMNAYDEANRLSYLARYGEGGFNFDAYRERLQAIEQLFPSGKSDLASDSDVPIFIVGMIRSGTTLVEQILRSHPEVCGAGEVSFWQREAEFPALMEAILSDTSRAQRLTSLYLQELRRHCPSSRFVTDKLPSNYQRLGLLRELFPSAKVIHCMRSPIDNALSIYTTPNRSPAGTREAVVGAYRLYESMMAHWRAVLPAKSFLDVQYECLVSNPKAEIRRLLDFCGLDWDEACLRPEQNGGEVRTPSLWQVRQPIHRNSVERWRKFEPWLGALRELVSD